MLLQLFEPRAAGVGPTRLWTSLTPEQPPLALCRSALQQKRIVDVSQERCVKQPPALDHSRLTLAGRTLGLVFTSHTASRYRLELKSDTRLGIQRAKLHLAPLAVAQTCHSAQTPNRMLRPFGTPHALSQTSHTMPNTP